MRQGVDARDGAIHHGKVEIYTGFDQLCGDDAQTFSRLFCRANVRQTFAPMGWTHEGGQMKRRTIFGAFIQRMDKVSRIGASMDNRENIVFFGEMIRQDLVRSHLTRERPIDLHAT